MRLCSVEFWTLNLEQYGNAKAVLIGNDYDLHHVYALSGDEKLSDPLIPTRMISQFASQHIGDLLAIHSNPTISFGCFQDVEIVYPSIICLVDTSNLGDYVYLDGEYQRQAHHLANDHPVWVKEGHEGLWSHMYMWLEVDQSQNGDDAMRWVIGTDTVNIIARCNIKSDDFEANDYIQHPALCDGHWYIQNVLRDTIITSDTSCSFGDNYVCVDSAEGGLFDSYFDGQYPQTLCMNDETNELSAHQSHYGVYVLDNSTTFDGRFVYKNQRLDGQMNEWYMLWYDEQDSWVLNEMVPEITAVRNHEGICDEEVNTPNLCNECWQFYDENGDAETKCSVKVE